MEDISDPDGSCVINHIIEKHPYLNDNTENDYNNILNILLPIVQKRRKNITSKI